MVDFRDYELAKSRFLKKHGGLVKIVSSPFENNSYSKNYIAKDGKVFYEVNTIKNNLTIVEFFDMDNSKSQFCFI